MTGAGFTYMINLNVQGTGAINGLIAMMDRLEGHLATISQNTTTLTERMTRMGNTGSNSFGSMASGARNLVAQLGVAALAMNSMTTAAQAQSTNNAINFASGGAVEGAKNIAFVRSEVERLGLPLQESLAGFKKLDASLMGGGYSQEFARNMFKGIGEGATAIGIPAEQVSSMLRAIGSMASKGTVSMEELKGELGEALPGTLSLAARAMHMPTDALTKLIEKGDLLSSVFLPRLQAGLSETFGAEATKNANSATSNFNRMWTAIYDLKVIVGEQLLPAVLPFLKDYLIPAVKWIGEHIDLITKLGGAILITYGFVKTWAFWEGVSTSLLIFKNTVLYFGGGAYGFYAAMTILARNASMTFAETLAVVNATLWANPVGVVIAGLLILGGAIYYAWQKSETFRATIMGLGSFLKELGNIIYEYAIQPLWALGKVMIGVFTGNTDLIKSGIEDGLNAVANMTGQAQSAGERLANAYNKGWNSEMGIYSNQAVQSVVPTDAVSAAFYDRDGAGAAGKPSDKVTQGINNITGGGAKQTHITINIGKLQDKIELHVTNAVEGIDRIGDEVLKKLTQVINNAQQAQVG